MEKLRAFVTPLVQSDYKSAAKKKQTTKSAKKQAHSEVQPEEITD